MYYVYLAGPITGLTWQQANHWRVEFAGLLGDSHPQIQCLSPLRSKLYLAEEKYIHDEYADTQLSSARGITVRDRFDSMRADMIVLNLLGATKVSIGSMIEVGWADSKRIPIVLIMEPDDKFHSHAMLRDIVAWTVPDVPGAVNIVGSVLTP